MHRALYSIALVALLTLALLAPGAAPAQDSRAPAESLSPAAPDDQALARRLAAAFKRIEPFQGIKVRVDQGVVTLDGKAPTSQAAAEAVKLAGRLGGVIYVVDRVEVDAAVESQLAPAWRKLRQLWDQALSYAPLLAIAGLIILAFYLVSRLVTAWEWPYRRLQERVLLRALVRQAVRYVFVFAGLLVALEILGLTALVGAFMGAAGVIGLALGFAFKDIAENYVAGFLLSVRSPFSFMDWIAVGEHQGSVVRVTSRELVIMTLEGNHVRIPNSQVFKGVIYNYTRNPLRRFDIELGIGVGEDLARVSRIGTSVLKDMKGVAADPGPTMRNLEFGDSAMLVRFSGWVDQATADFLKVRSEAVRILKEALDAGGVDVPVPISMVIAAPEAAAGVAPAAPADGEELRQEARRADVDRETVLDEQIARDRRQSREVDLLSEGQGATAAGGTRKSSPQRDPD